MQEGLSALRTLPPRQNLLHERLPIPHPPATGALTQPRSSEHAPRRAVLQDDALAQRQGGADEPIGRTQNPLGQPCESSTLSSGMPAFRRGERARARAGSPPLEWVSRCSATSSEERELDPVGREQTACPEPPLQRRSNALPPRYRVWRQKERRSGPATAGLGVRHCERYLGAARASLVVLPGTTQGDESHAAKRRNSGFSSTRPDRTPLGARSGIIPDLS
jgi:hypothetical protein